MADLSYRTHERINQSRTKAPDPDEGRSFRSAALRQGMTSVIWWEGTELLYVPGSPKVEPFWMAKYPTTWRQYLNFCAQTGRKEPERPQWQHELNFLDHPVVNVSFHDAIAYCLWAGLTLPTVAEWEFAALSDDGRPYPWGKEQPSADRLNCYPFGPGRTTKVGSYPNGVGPFGHLDLAGNVWEWCCDPSDRERVFHPFRDGLTRRGNQERGLPLKNNQPVNATRTPATSSTMDGGPPIGNPLDAGSGAVGSKQVSASGHGGTHASDQRHPASSVQQGIAQASGDHPFVSDKVGNTPVPPYGSHDGKQLAPPCSPHITDHFTLGEVRADPFGSALAGQVTSDKLQDSEVSLSSVAKAKSQDGGAPQGNPFLQESAGGPHSTQASHLLTTAATGTSGSQQHTLETDLDPVLLRGELFPFASSSEEVAGDTICDGTTHFHKTSGSKTPAPQEKVLELVRDLPFVQCKESAGALTPTSQDSLSKCTTGGRDQAPAFGPNQESDHPFGVGNVGCVSETGSPTSSSPISTAPAQVSSGDSDPHPVRVDPFEQSKEGTTQAGSGRHSANMMCESEAPVTAGIATPGAASEQERASERPFGQGTTESKGIAGAQGTASSISESPPEVHFPPVNTKPTASVRTRKTVDIWCKPLGRRCPRAQPYTSRQHISKTFRDTSFRVGTV